jgi:long-chain acyl-CoA synthetase
MYPGPHAVGRAQKPAITMAETGETVTYAQLEARSNRLAHLLRAQRLRRLDHYAIFMENNIRFVECCSAGERSGLYYTCINSFLNVDEVAYILNNCQAKVLITSKAKRETAMAALSKCPDVALCLIADGEGDDTRVGNLDEATAPYPMTPVADEWVGGFMLYSSGTTGRPKGVLHALPEKGPSVPARSSIEIFRSFWKYREGMIMLSPAPLYHAAPLLYIGFVIRMGGTALIMERFEPERYLEFVEAYRVTHSLLVPTMFSRMLKLSEAARNRYDHSSLEIAIHGAAPCPVPVKEQMIGWWGPIVHEYYGSTEGNGATGCDSLEWLAHKGTVGKVRIGELRVLDHEMKPVPTGSPGKLWFKSPAPFAYFNDSAKTAQAYSSDGALSTLGDVGYIDEDGYVYLTDRAAFMIISGGVNIYPQECENLLITHPKVADAAVFGVPNEDLGEEVKAVVQLMPDFPDSPEVAAELLAFCAAHLARYKCPRSVDFIAALPRLPTGKLYKRILRDPYWEGRKSLLV